MSDYALLVAPSVNRVYAADAPRLLAAELDITMAALGLAGDAVRLEAIAGLDYLLLSGIGDEARLAALVASSSAAYALFAREGALLRPVELPATARFSDDLVTIQKYTGKTNEQLTTLLMNVTLAASARPQLLTGGRAKLLDPVCGRGTTLNLALRRGFDGYGVDVDRKDVEAYSVFLKTWARTHRLPHTHSFAPVRRHKKTIAQRLDVELFTDRAAQRSGHGQRVAVAVADTTAVTELFAEGTMDAVVGDLPYGVAHGAHRGHDLDRRADDLVAAAMPSWARMLKPGGALGLSFNTKTLARADVEDACRRVGLQVAPYGDRFAHRVDASIARDLVVASRPAAGSAAA
ncbi:TRM11 family SAM-dependent methyltransferase [Cumulibacter manganitolerans]|uniref:TRM11 family SAM-dependent methyltransferase n=1 Tax=Cumulibacter manganitolerans TaxID=1884992 RepID=UPI0012963F8D|nr:SAM-dependent methyltransferase [Cumulibacter manganitolerans]